MDQRKEQFSKVNDLCTESKDLIQRYETETVPRDLMNINKIRERYNELVQRFEITKNNKNSNTMELMELIDSFKTLINELIQKINESEHRIISLEQRLLALEEKDSERNRKIQINKYMIAIQDYNAMYGIERILEKNTNGKAKDSLSKMRKNRNGQCHYCSKFCNDKEAAQRFSVMIQRIETMDPKVHFVIEKRYPGLLGAIIATKHNKIKLFEDIDNQINDEINEWWDEMV